MSGRPKKLFRWATSTVNYPAGVDPWNGQTIRVLPAGDYITPDTTPAAEDYNYIWGVTLDQEESILDWAGSSPALNWSQQFAPLNTATDATEAAWDAVSRQWIVANWYIGGSVDVWATKGADGGQAAAWYSVTPTHVITSAQVATGVCAHPSTPNTFYLVLSNTVSTGALHVYKAAGGGAWSLLRTAGTNNEFVRMLGVHVPSPSADVIVYAAGASTNADTGLSYSTNGGTSWTDVFYGSASFSSGVTEWILKANPLGQVLAVPHTAGPTHYLQAPDAQAYAVETLPSIGLGAIWGLDWDDANGQWVLASVLTGATTFWSSADGINWVQIGAGTHAFAAADLACLGSLYLVTTQDASQVSGQYFSIDGGLTWHPTQAGFATNDTGVGATRSLVRSSDLGFVTLNSLHLRLSNMAGVPVPLL